MAVPVMRGSEVEWGREDENSVELPGEDMQRRPPGCLIEAGVPLPSWISCWYASFCPLRGGGSSRDDLQARHTRRRHSWRRGTSREPTTAAVR
jgi:hypothetical protein